MHSLLVLNTHLASSFWYEYYFKSTKKNFKMANLQKRTLILGLGSQL